jgi:hypothetical protein
MQIRTYHNAGNTFKTLTIKGEGEIIQINDIDVCHLSKEFILSISDDICRTMYEYDEFIIMYINHNILRYEFSIEIKDLNLVTDLDFSDVDTKDYPDFADAYPIHGYYDGKLMNNMQLNQLNDEFKEFVHEKLRE